MTGRKLRGLPFIADKGGGCETRVKWGVTNGSKLRVMHLSESSLPCILRDHMGYLACLPPEAVTAGHKAAGRHHCWRPRRRRPTWSTLLKKRGRVSSGEERCRVVWTMQRAANRLTLLVENTRRDSKRDKENEERLAGAASTGAAIAGRARVRRRRC